MSRVSQGLYVVLGALIVLGAGCRQQIPIPGGPGGDPLEDLSIEEIGEVTEFGALNDENLFIIGVGHDPVEFQTVPVLPKTQPIDTSDLKKGSGLLQVQEVFPERPCLIGDCTPVDEPPSLLPRFQELVGQRLIRCRRCERIRNSCDQANDLLLSSECEFCSNFCWPKKETDGDSDQTGDP